MTTDKILHTVELPLNPDNHYGTASTALDLFHRVSIAHIMGEASGELIQVWLGTPTNAKLFTLVGTAKKDGKIVFVGECADPDFPKEVDGIRVNNLFAFEATPNTRINVKTQQ